MQLGLSQGETKVYLSLLKLGQCRVHDIKVDTKLHRTTIYDFLSKLETKGLVSSVKKTKTSFYKAADPQLLYNLIKEKEYNLNELLPKLIQLSNLKKEPVEVEVYSGKEGFKSFSNLILKEKKDLIGVGMEERRYDEEFAHFMHQQIKKELRLGIKERIIVGKNNKFTYNYRNVKYRKLSAENNALTPVMVFGDYVVLHIWDPLTNIVIKNKSLSSSFRIYLEMIWKLAKPVKQ